MPPRLGGATILTMPSGPKFIRFFWPILEALRDLGGAAPPREVIDLAIEKLGIADDERAERTKSGSLRGCPRSHELRVFRSPKLAMTEPCASWL